MSVQITSLEVQLRRIDPDLKIMKNNNLCNNNEKLVIISAKFSNMKGQHIELTKNNFINTEYIVNSTPERKKKEKKKIPMFL